MGFDDSALDDQDRLDAYGERLRDLALCGARLRSSDHARCGNAAALIDRPRAILAVGPEARLLRAVVEPTCPVPFVAWPMPSLPSWVGPLDLVVALAGADDRLANLISDARRRGAQVLLVAPSTSPVVERVTPEQTVLVSSEDPFVQALLALKVLDSAGLAPEVDLVAVADALDATADDCGPRRPLGSNPAKELACALADTVPLIWGKSVLAARASRRIAEAVREATFYPALAADDVAIEPLIAFSGVRDLFEDPVETPSSSIRYSLLLLDDRNPESVSVDLASVAQSRGVRVVTIQHSEGSPVERYAVILSQGLFAALWLHVANAGG
ncbi:MAG: hypothetical protein LBN10_02075 [Propionibacteriaceae bacterium]|jgi:hypothetical protein|nr:hypothetical protein [Propionibacteriaceae bacterium]